MDDKDFKIKTLEFHIENNSNKYNKCISNAVKDFLNSNKDFNTLQCDSLKKIIDDLFEQYKLLNN
jgi:hypothetical protein